jgi:hypothetical protein
MAHRAGWRGLFFKIRNGVARVHCNCLLDTLAVLRARVVLIQNGDVHVVGAARAELANDAV